MAPSGDQVTTTKPTLTTLRNASVGDMLHRIGTTMIVLTKPKFLDTLVSGMGFDKTISKPVARTDAWLDVAVLTPQRGKPAIWRHRPVTLDADQQWSLLAGQQLPADGDIVQNDLTFG